MPMWKKSLPPRERMAAGRCAFGFCLLTVNTLFDAGAGAGWAAAVAGWYALLTSPTAPHSGGPGESRFLLATNLALALLSLALGSSDYFRMWDTLALLLVLLPVHAVGLSGGQRLPWWRPAMLWERLCLLLWGLFGHLWAAVAALLPEKRDSSARRYPAAVLGSAGAAALLAILVPVLASADALFAAATADLRAFLALHFTDAVWKAVVAARDDALLLRPAVQPPPPQAPAAAGGKAPPARWTAWALPSCWRRLAALYLLFLGVQSAGLFGGADVPGGKRACPTRSGPEAASSRWCGSQGSTWPSCSPPSSGPGGRAPPGGRCGFSPPCSRRRVCCSCSPPPCG